jgi:hypothetical protein
MVLRAEILMQKPAEENPEEVEENLEEVEEDQGHPANKQNIYILCIISYKI